MHKKKTDIERILSKIRNITIDEFENSGVEGCSMEALEKEVDYLISKFTNLSSRQKELVKNVENHLIENKYEAFEYSEKGDQIDVIAMSFNTYLEELKNKMISKDYFQEIFNEIPLNIIILDVDQKIENANRSGIHFFTISGSFDEQNLEVTFTEPIKNLIQQFYISNELKTEVELEINLEKNSKVYLLCNLLKIQLSDNSHVLFISKDITERKFQQIQLIEATIDGQEAERKRLAIEIHDSLGQELSSLKMNLNTIQNSTTNSDTYEHVLHNMDSIVKSAVQTVKDISFNLKPTLLTSINLRTALERLIEVMTISPLTIRFMCTDNEIKLKNKNDELFVYRIIQEFLNNSLKHAQADYIAVEIRKNVNKKQYKISLRDNGIGFELSEKTLGNGVSNIFHRLKILNAEFNFVSEHSKGTQLDFYISYIENT